jgi:ribonuclease D
VQIVLHQGDIPDGLAFPKGVAIDTEAMGLKIGRDRLCLVQLCGGDNICHLVQIACSPSPAPHLTHLLADPQTLKIFHFARFDVLLLEKTFRTPVTPFYCTKLASKIVRTYTDQHGLKSLCRHLLKIETSKEEQTSDWGSETLSSEQQRYAAADVVHLHALKERLDAMLQREGKVALFQAGIRGLIEILHLESAGFDAEGLFRH